MEACFLLTTLLSVGLLGQTIIGTVSKIDKDQIQITTQDGTVMLSVNERTTVRKGTVLNDVSELAVGDEIRATCYGEGSLTAANISAKVTFAGVITESGSAYIKVIPDSIKDVSPPGRKTAIFVFLQPGTRFGTNPKRMIAGQRVHIVGWDSGNGVVDADKVALYDTDLPLRRPSRPRAGERER